MKRIQQPSMQEAEQASLNHEILNTWRPGETLGEHMERRGASFAYYQQGITGSSRMNVLSVTKSVVSLLATEVALDVESVEFVDSVELEELAGLALS